MTETKLDRNAILRDILLHNHDNPIALDINKKISIINKVIEFTANDPAQGSKEWVSERQIGGSDAAAVLGKGYFGKGMFEIVRDKIFPGGGFSGNIATRFGRVMEEVSRLIIEKIFNTVVWEFKSLPNQLKYTSYSPDGIAVAEIFHKIMMLLLEFKTPFSRIPDGKIPKEYLPQIKSGMCAVPMVDGSLFISTMLRFCSLDDFKYNFDYNTVLHKGDISTCKSRPVTHKSKLDQIIAMGLSIIIQTPKQKAAYDADKKTIDPLLISMGLNSGRVVHSNGETYIMRDNDYGIESKLFSDNSQAANVFKIPEYGNINEYDTDTIFNIIDEKRFAEIYHIPPFIVGENLAKMPFFKSCGMKDNSSNTTSEITEAVHTYFIESMEFCMSN